MNQIRIVMIVIFAAIATTGHGESERIQIGRAKPAWHDLSGVDGKLHSLADMKNKEVVVVAITCNHCPIAIEYYERINEFAIKHCGEESKVGLVAISVSNLETDRLPRMKEFAKRRSFQFPYLHDQTQQIAKDLGATNTPQFFVLDQDRVLVYRGAWDDDLNPTKVKNRYVENAVKAVVEKRPVSVSETKPSGCPIEFDGAIKS